MITISAILAWITSAASNPYTLVAIAAVIMALPNETLLRIPIIGSFTAGWLHYWATKQLQQFKSQREAIDAEAERIVREKEQAIKSGRLDKTSAGALAKNELSNQFRLPPEVAGRLIEAAVNRVNGSVIEAIPYDVTLEGKAQ